MILKILTDDNVQEFNKAAPKHEVVLVGFFMVNCPACEAFAKPWQDFINDCKKKNDPSVLIAEVDSNQASNVNFDTSILEGFPSVFRDVKNEKGIVEFKKNRTKEDLLEFLREAMAKKGGKRKTKRRRGSRRKRKIKIRKRRKSKLRKSKRRKSKTRKSKIRKSKIRKRRKRKTLKGGINSTCAMWSHSEKLLESEQEAYKEGYDLTQKTANKYCKDMDENKPFCIRNIGECSTWDDYLEDDEYDL